MGLAVARGHTATTEVMEVFICPVGDTAADKKKDLGVAKGANGRDLEQ